MNEEDFFKKLMQKAGITPQKDRNTIDPPPKKNPKARRRQQSEDDDSIDIPLSDFISDPVEAEQSLSFITPGIQHRVMRDLKLGKITPQARLDLHGVTIEETRLELYHFISSTQEQGCRCVCVVHGKGHRSDGAAPILKNQVNTWLRQLPGILAFCSAPRRDGGTGAVYILQKVTKHSPPIFDNE